MIPKSKIKFVCGLSNGEDLVEGRGILESVPGEDSPWWKLQKYLKDNNLTITSFYLSLAVDTPEGKDVRHFHLPSIGPKFGGMSPIKYNCFRRYIGDTLGTGDNYEHYIIAEAFYPKFKVQLWVDEKEGEKSWINIVKLRYGKPVE